MTNISKTQWQIQAETASLDNGQLTASVDLKHPAKGLSQLTYLGKQISGCHPLQVSPEPPAPKTGETLIDSYVRGRDLVATYAQTPQRSVQPTYYWHCLESAGGAAGVELMVSMQTSLLDSDPTLTAFSECHGTAHWICDGKEFAIDDARWESPTGAVGFLLFRLDGDVSDGDISNGDISYVEMVYPSDFLGVTIQRSDKVCRLSYRMFPEDLEKGVIRRGRIRAYWTATKDDVATAVGAYEELIAADPPLTT